MFLHVPTIHSLADRCVAQYSPAKRATSGSVLLKTATGIRDTLLRNGVGTMPLCNTLHTSYMGVLSRCIPTTRLWKHLDHHVSSTDGSRILTLRSSTDLGPAMPMTMGCHARLQPKYRRWTHQNECQLSVRGCGGGTPT